MSQTKIRIAWLCQFSNQEMKDYFNTPDINESAPWISLLIDLIKEQNEIELHIVAPNAFTNTDTFLRSGNVNYHFYRHLLIPKGILSRLYLRSRYIRKAYSLLRIDSFINYALIKLKINKIVSNINPDLIHLHGVENPVYSIGIFQFLGKKPTLVTIQGFFRNAYDRNSFIHVQRVKNEEQILRSAVNFGVRANFMKDYISQFNPKAKFYWIQYPYANPELNSNIEKNCDIVFFGRISKEKGIEDLLHALGIATTKSNRQIKLRVIGSVSENYLSLLKSIADKYGILSNIQFVGFLPTQKDLHQLAIQSRICVFPTYDDIYSGTIVECMFMKIPVIAYKIPGLLDLQTTEKQNLIFVEKGDINGLANAIVKLLSDEKLQSILSDNGYERVTELFDRGKIVTNLLQSYNEIIKSF